MTSIERLHLISFAVQRAKLMSLAVARNTIPPSGDLGYALHQVLNEAFGADAPKPFHFFEEPGGPLLAYSAHSAPELQQIALRHRAAAGGSPALAAETLGLPSMEAYSLSENWQRGRRYRFHVRTRPVCRIARHQERGLPRECDVFVRAAASSQSGSEGIDKQDVYAAWFREQIPEAAATLLSVRVCQLRRIQVYRKGAPRLDGPDVSFSGVLEVGEPAAFHGCVKRGVGRHRAFGFGMILLEGA